MIIGKRVIEMKLLHISDLHLGKVVNSFSMISEQSYILDRMFELIEREKIGTVLISGDVFDKTNPSVEAVKLYDSMMTRFYEKGIKVIMISGNHDSPERLSQYSTIVEAGGIYNNAIFDGAPEKIVLNDEYGEINFYPLSFFRISEVNNVYGTDFDDYTKAFSYLVDKMNIDKSKRNVLLCHQFIAGSTMSESETSIGGVDYISKEAFGDFDYTAMGHIHRPQSFNDGRLCYCGTMLKYASNESGQTKYFFVVEIGEKKAGEEFCELKTEKVPIVPLHEMRKIVGKFEDLISMPVNEKGIVTDDYVFITLLNDTYVEEAARSLSSLYPGLMNVSYDFKANSRENADAVMKTRKIENESPADIFKDLYKVMHQDKEMNEEQERILMGVINKLWGDKA